MTTEVQEQSGKLVRTVGFWGLVAMCINAVVGSGVFLLPTESYKLLGPFSLWAPLIFAIPVFILVLCFAEAASHFSEPGGAYLYARTGRAEVISARPAEFGTSTVCRPSRAISRTTVSDIGRRFQVHIVAGLHQDLLAVGREPDKTILTLFALLLHLRGGNVQVLRVPTLLAREHEERNAAEGRGLRVSKPRGEGLV